MTVLQNVSITITQGATTIWSGTTDAFGNASTTLNTGTYTISFAYAGRSPITTEITITADNTAMFFCFPNYVIASCTFSASLLYDNDVSGANDTHSYTATNLFTNS